MTTVRGSHSHSYRTARAPTPFLRVSAQELQAMAAELVALAPHAQAREIFSQLQQLGQLDGLSPVDRSRFAQFLQRACLARRTTRAGGIHQVAATDSIERSAAVHAASPTGQAQQAIAAERAFTERDKYNFTPAQRKACAHHNSVRIAKNQKIRTAADKVDQQIQDVLSNDKLKPKQKEKKLKALEAKKAKILKQIKPPVNLETVTAEVDGVMNNPNIDPKNRKKEIEKIRRKYGLHKWKGGMSMRSMFTNRLANVYKRSERRLRKTQTTHQKQLQGQIKEATKLYGKDSPEVLALKAQLGSVKNVYKKEVSRLSTNSAVLRTAYKRPTRNIFKKIGRFFKKVWKGIKTAFKWVGKALDFVMPIVKMIPGIGQIAGAVYSGVKAVGNLVTGNWKGALKNVLGAIPAVGSAIGAVGGVVGKVADVVSKGYKLVKSGVGVITGIAKGNIAGALGSLGSGFGTAGLGDVASHVSTAAKVAGGVQSVARGDVMGAFGAASAVGGVMPDEVKNAFAPVGSAVADVRNAVSNVAGAIPDEVIRGVNAGVHMHQAVQHASGGDFGAMTSSLGGFDTAIGLGASGALEAAYNEFSDVTHTPRRGLQQFAASPAGGLLSDAFPYID